MGKIAPSSYMQCMHRMHALDYSIVQKIGRYKESEELQHHLASGAAISICKIHVFTLHFHPSSNDINDINGVHRNIKLWN